jgi:peptidoglycan/LPS O-acetylase OafA/YrhL
MAWASVYRSPQEPSPWPVRSRRCPARHLHRRGRRGTTGTGDAGISLREIFYRKEGSHVDALDGVRAICVLWVTAYHAWFFRCGFYDESCGPGHTVEPFSVSAFGAVVGRGDLAVDVFFALSGYLIFRILRTSLMRENVPLGRSVARFTLRRFLRIYPALAFAIPLNILIFYFVALPGVPSGTSNPIVAGCIDHPWANFALLGNWTALAGPAVQFDDGRLGCLPWTWSVSMEAQFYLLSPLLAIYYIRARATARERNLALRWWTGSLPALALIGISLVAQLLISLHFDLHTPPRIVGEGASAYMAWDRADTYMTWIYGNSLTRVVPFLLGVAAAAYRWHMDSDAASLQRQARDEDFDRRMRIGGRMAMGAAAFFLIAGALPITPWAGFNLFLLVLGRALFGAITALVLAISAAPRAGPIWWVRLLRHPFWVAIARLSYSMYLWQFVGIEAARLLLEALGMRPDQGFAPLLAFVTLGIGISFAIAIPCYLFVEKPGMDYRPAL